jgi:hypothetical protein
VNHPWAAGTFGAAAAVSSGRLCLVYDATSGEILHTHRVVTLEGGTEPSDDEIARYAVLLAQRRAGADQRLEALHVERGALEPGRRYRVDYMNKALVAEQKRT